jgi:peptide/nickel transport system substrate-binding protein
MRKFILAACVLLILSLLATGLTAGTLRVGVPETFTGFGPYDARSRVDYYVTMNVLERLVTYGPDFVPQPQLATSWETPDDTTWIFNLRDGITFQDGTPLNAEAVKFSLELWLAGRYGGRGGAVSEINALDDLTVEIKLSAPFPTLTAVLTQPWGAIISPTAYEALGADEFAKAPVGTGPFSFVSWDSGTSEVVLEANPNYWGTDGDGNALPYLDRVEFKIQPDVAASALALLAGDVDLIAKVSNPLVEQLKSNPQTEVQEVSTLGWVYTFLNTQAAPFDDVGARRAFQFAVDRQTIVDVAESGRGVPALGPLTPGSWAYDPNIETGGLYGAGADLERARAELGDSGGFEFTLSYPNEEPWKTIAPLVQAQLAEVGITANLDGRDIGAVLDDMFAGNFEALMIDWSGRIDEDLSTAAFYRCEGGNNFGQYCNSEVDALLTRAGQISDRAERTALYQQAQGLINEDAPIILFYFPTELKALRSAVAGFQTVGDQRIYLQNVSLAE